MTSYRALIVDDSRSARHSLAKLLEAHELGVEFAASGEEALEFLKDHLVDVIFMDHTMPGMDGLEAVKAIKSNPRTATIPVMMYTTKEGDVYVGQARALGAVDVLPKQVQPGVLFDMLLKLGLVTDRRAPDRPSDPEAPRRRFADLVEDVDREYEQRALGASVQALLTRMLEAQHQQLRSDLQSSHRRFAKQVAAEIVAQQPPPAPPEAPRSGRGGARLLQAAAVLLAAGLATVGNAYWQLRIEHGAATDALAQQQAEHRYGLAERDELRGILAGVEARRGEDEALKAAAAQALVWALNQDTRVPVEGPPFNATMADRLPELLDHLKALGFRGEVVLTAHLGRFCLVRDDYGGWQPAPGDLPAASCDLIGHPLDGAFSSAALQAVEFADALRSADVDDVSVELRTTSAETATGLWPAGPRQRAGDLNAEAALANRVEISLVPGGVELLGSTSRP